MICDTFNTTIETMDYSCPWLFSTSNKPYLTICRDGSECNLLDSGLHCCDCHGGPARCPPTDPFMCAMTDGSHVCMIEGCVGIGMANRYCAPSGTPMPHHIWRANCTHPPGLPPQPPLMPSAPWPPNPPNFPPAPAGVALVAHIRLLRAALNDPSVIRIVLLKQGSPYVLDAELQVARQVIIEAELGGGEVIIDAAASEATPRRVMRIFASANVTLIGLTLTGAWMPQGSVPSGGAIANEGTLEMVECVIRANHAYAGGGVFTEGQVKMRDCTISSNSAEFVGGAVQISGASAQLDATNCTFKSNNASYGGALWFDVTAAGSPTVRTLSSSLDECMLLGNRARHNGGAIDNFGTLAIARSQIMYNAADNVGGGIENSGGSARLFMKSSIGTCSRQRWRMNGACAKRLYLTCLRSVPLSERS